MFSLNGGVHYQPGIRRFIIPTRTDNQTSRLHANPAELFGGHSRPQRDRFHRSPSLPRIIRPSQHKIYGFPLLPVDLKLRKAIAHGTVADIRKAIADGAHVNYADELGNRPLLEAVMLGKQGATVVLLELGARPNARDALNETALFKAAMQQNWSAMMGLLDYDADPDLGPETGETPLMYAVPYGDASLPVTRKLLEHDANPNTCDLLGFTPLIIASRSGSRKTMQLLLDYGANADAKDVSGKSVLMHTVESGTPEMLTTVLQHKPKPDINYCNPKNGKTALSTAIFSGNLEAVRVLLAHKARIQPGDIYQARKNGDIAILQALQQRVRKRGFSFMESPGGDFGERPGERGRLAKSGSMPQMRV